MRVIAHCMADEHHRIFWGEGVLPGSGYGGFGFFINVGSHQWVRYNEYVTCIWMRQESLFS